MTAARRTALLLLAGLAAGLLPACLSIGGTVAPVNPKPADPLSQFAVYPTRPGEKRPTNSVTTTAGSPSQTTSRRPTPEPPAIVAAGPEAPLPPDNSLRPVQAISGPLPLAPAAPAGMPESPLVAAVRASVENRPDEAIRQLQSLDKPNQDFALAVIPLLLRGAQLNPDKADPNDVAVLVEQLHAAADRLEGRAALRVDKIAFCRRVSGFGRYDPWPEAQPYRPRDLAELYVEIRHVTSEPAAGPNGEPFVTRLVSTLEIRDANGRLVEQTSPDDRRLTVPIARFERTDFSRTPPRDYFLKYRFPVPSAPGVYTAVVEVKDAAGNRTVRSKPARFDVAGP